MGSPFVPIAKTKREHVGMIERVPWTNGIDDRPVALLALTDGASVFVRAAEDEFAKGVIYRFLGKWVNGKKGYYFQAEAYAHEEPTDPDGVARYVRHFRPAFGAKNVAKLYEKFGPETLRTIREEPVRAAADSGVPPTAVADLSGRLSILAATEKDRVEVFRLVTGKGFPAGVTGHATTTWPTKAAALIRRNPFRLLLAQVPGCGFKRCDKLFLDMGGRRDSLKRQFMCAWQAIRDDRSGSTWVPAQTVADAMAESIPGPTRDPVKAMRLGIRSGWIRIRREGQEKWLATSERAAVEQRIADAVERLVAVGEVWPGGITESVTTGDGRPTGHQVGQLKLATAKAVGCLTGGPGCGKTFTLAALLRRIVELHGAKTVAVVAPTGKAAVRATEAMIAAGLDLRAQTIHKLLQATSPGKGGWGFAHNRNNPIPHTFVIVDESSMVDAPLMANLLDACGEGSQVLLVGDPFQLPPVGHGAPLRDIIASGRVGVGELTEVRRNAGMIVRGCAAIKAGGRVDTTAAFDLDSPEPRNLKLSRHATADVMQHVECVLAGMSRFDPVWDTQVIVPLNAKSELSRAAVNKKLAVLLNPYGRRVDRCPFAVGDKVIRTQNGMLSRAEPKGSARYAAGYCQRCGRQLQDPTSLSTGYGPECRRKVGDAPADPRPTDDPANYHSRAGDADRIYVANGEIGRVAAVSDSALVISFGTDRLAWVPLYERQDEEENPVAEEDEGEQTPLKGFDLAYAITVHRSQGSEWPCVIALVDPAAGAVADRNFWYTAISRAKTACLLVGDAAAFASQCQRQSLARRRTFLAELLKQANYRRPEPVRVVTWPEFLNTPTDLAAEAVRIANEPRLVVCGWDDSNTSFAVAEWHDGPVPDESFWVERPRHSDLYDREATIRECLAKRWPLVKTWILPPIKHPPMS